MDRPSPIRRLAGLCVAVLILAVVTTAPATAQTSTVTAPTVVNPGNQTFVEFDPVQLQMTAVGGTAPYTL